MPPWSSLPYYSAPCIWVSAAFPTGVGPSSSPYSAGVAAARATRPAASAPAWSRTPSSPPPGAPFSRRTGLPACFRLDAPADQAGGEQPVIHAPQASHQPRGEQRCVPDLAQVFGHFPDVSVRRHPVNRIEAPQVDGPGVISERLFLAQIEVVLEVRHRQLAQRAVYRLAEAESREVGFRQGAPMPEAAEDGEHVIVVPHGFEVEQQRRLAHHGQSGGGEQGALHAVGGAVPEDAARRAAGGAGRFLVVPQVVEESLDFLGRLQAAEDRALAGGECKMGHWVSGYRKTGGGRTILDSR